MLVKSKLFTLWAFIEEFANHAMSYGQSVLISQGFRPFCIFYEVIPQSQCLLFFFTIVFSFGGS